MAEARSHDERKLAELVQEMLDSITFAASLAECEVETADRGDATAATASSRTTCPCASPRGAASAPASSRRYALTGGGADANVFNARGLQCLNLANGMADIHTPDEHIAVADLEGMVEVDARARRRRARCRLACAAAP